MRATMCICRIPLPKSNDFCDNPIRLNGYHNERTKAGDILHIVESDNSKTIGLPFHLHYKPVG